VNAAIQKSKKTKDCECGDTCDCDNCQCKPGKKCDDNGCKTIKGVETCYVRVGGRVYLVEGMSPAQANAAIRAQGPTVVFLDRWGRVVSAPTWCTVPVETAPTTPIVAAPVVPIYQAPSAGIGFGFRGPFGGGFSFGAGG
jgi:hypothetical protein